MAYRLGRYLLLERINQGGMADVYLGKLFGVGGADHILALKCIKPEVLVDPGFVSMFMDEAKLCVQLDHPNIVRAHEFGRAGGNYFIALEYVPGRDVRALFERVRSLNRALPVELALHIVTQVLEGLEYAHRKTDSAGVSLKLVHRDVSPQNVLISYEGAVKLIDFGIADTRTQTVGTEPGVVRGKYGYMSPEQVRGEPLDVRSDVFSAGILLYELLTMQRLFSGSSDFSILDKVRYAEVLPPSLVSPIVSPELEAVVLRALAARPDDRFASAAAMRDALVAEQLKAFRTPPTAELATWVQAIFAEERAYALTLFARAQDIVAMPPDLAALPHVADDHALADQTFASSTDPEALTPEDTDERRRTEDTTIVPSATVIAEGMVADNESTVIGISPLAVQEAAAAADATTGERDVEDTSPTTRAMARLVRRDTARDTARDTTREGAPSDVVVEGEANGTGSGTRIIPGVRGRRRRALRGVAMVVGALALSTALVVTTWYFTRRSRPVPRGAILVDSSPEGAEVLVDGAVVGKTPLTASAVVAGRRAVTVRLDGFVPQTYAVRVSASETLRYVFELVPVAASAPKADSPAP